MLIAGHLFEKNEMSFNPFRVFLGFFGHGNPLIYSNTILNASGKLGHSKSLSTNGPFSHISISAVQQRDDQKRNAEYVNILSSKEMLINTNHLLNKWVTLLGSRQHQNYNGQPGFTLRFVEKKIEPTGPKKHYFQTGSNCRQAAY